MNIKERVAVVTGTANGIERTVVIESTARPSIGEKITLLASLMTRVPGITLVAFFPFLRFGFND